MIQQLKVRLLCCMLFTTLMTLLSSSVLFAQSSICDTQWDGDDPPYVAPTTCPPADRPTAIAGRGFMFACDASQSNCPVFPTPTDPLEPVVPSCPLQAIDYQEPEAGVGVFIQYWNACVNDSITAQTPIYVARDQGFINQLFCAIDAYGYPAAPAAQGAPVSGIISTLPQASEDMPGVLDIIGYGDCDPDTFDPAPPGPVGANGAADIYAELIQIDFWMLVPSNLTSVGFSLGGIRYDAAMFMVGPDLNNMCVTADFSNPGLGGAQNPEYVGVTESYYNIPPDAPIVCGGKVLRVRLYITDIEAYFTVTPQINIGNGFQSIENITGATLVEAESGDDNTIPNFPLTPSQKGLTDDDGNIFDLDGNWLPFACGDGVPTNVFTTDNVVLDEVCANDPTVNAIVIDVDATYNNCAGDLSFTYSSNVPQVTFSGGVMTIDYANLPVGDFTFTITATGPGTLQCDIITFTLPVDPCCEFLATCNLDPTIPQSVEGCSPIDVPAPETDYNNVFTNIGTEPCGTLTLIHEDVVTGTLCPDGFTITRTYTLFDDLAPANGVLDANEAFETCVEIFTVVDITPPGIACPANVVQSTDPQLCTAVVPDIAPVKFGDNCDETVTITYILTGATTGSGVNDASGTTFNLGTTTVTYTITDACGLTASCSFTVTIEDTEPPFVFCGKTSIAVPTAPGTCEANVFIKPPVANDNCSGAVTVTVIRSDNLPLSAPYPVGSTLISWIFTDAAGNVTICTKKIIVVDKEPPSFTNCNTQTQIFCDDETVTFDIPTATDNCGNVTVTQTSGYAPGSNFPVGTTEVCFTVFDDSGNRAICCFDIVVLAPIKANSLGDAFCNANNEITYQFTLTGGYPSYNGGNYNVSVSANAGNPSITPTSGGTGQTFTITLDTNAPIGTTVNITVTDAQACSTDLSFTTNFQCCSAEAGFVDATLQCPEDDTEVSVSNYQTGANYATYVILTDENGVILGIFNVTNTAGQVDIPYSDWEDLYNGTGVDYNFYSYNVLIGSEPNPQPTVGSTINAIGNIQEGCFDLSNGNTGSLYVPTPLIVTCDELIDNGSNGGTGPFYYNTYEICVTGGTQPYDYEWDTWGYVRQSIIGNGLIRIIYADNAVWHVTITDANGCAFNNGESFTNDPDQTGGTGEVLDVYDHQVTNATTSGGCQNGSISIYAEGGDGNYTFTWTSPTTWPGYTGPGDSSHGAGTNNVSTMENLPVGWYYITVTDGSGQTTDVAHYVNCGRGKQAVDLANTSNPHLSISPNPLVDKGLIEFSVAKEGRVNIALFGINGQKMQDLFEGEVPANEINQLPITLKDDLPTGLYFIRMSSDVGKQWHQKVFISK